MESTRDMQSHFSGTRTVHSVRRPRPDRTRTRRLKLSGVVFAVAVRTLPLSGAAQEEAGLVQNGGFENLDAQGNPVAWHKAPGFRQAEIIEHEVHSGRRAGQIRGDGKQYCLRQTISQPPARINRASGWFQGRNAVIDKANGDFVRFYFHVLYKDRPYAETTHIWADLPDGTYAWRKIGVLVAPRVDHPVSEVWVTVAAKFSGGSIAFDDIQLVPVGYRGGFHAVEWRRAADAVVLTDMSRVTPASALSERARRGKWKRISYESSGHSGVMLWASDETHAPVVALPLNAQGWHAVYVGLAAPAGVANRVLLRLSGDSAFVPRVRVRGNIEEVLFKIADLTGRSLEIAQEYDSVCRAAGVAYVKLVPLTAEEQARVAADRAESANRRLVASIDGFSFIYARRPVSRAALLEEVEVYRDTDFGTLMLQMGGADLLNYPSRFGTAPGHTAPGQDLDDFPRPGDRRYAEALQELAARGINPTRVLIEGAHDVGMTVYVAIRPGAWKHTPPMDDFFASRFYERHPEWRCRDRDGNEVPRMSLAVPEVRTHLVDVLREAVRFGADGACIIFVRGAPFVLWEPPFRDLFRKKYGQDPITLPEKDERVRRLRCEIVTEFMREVRKMLDEESAERGRRLDLAAYVFASEEDNLGVGLDVAAWCREGLVQHLCPYLGAGGGKAREYDMAFFRRIAAPHGVRVTPTFVAWKIRDMARIVRQALNLYRAGADGISFWDANVLAGRMDRWPVVSRMGHVAELAEYAEDGLLPPVTARFHRIGRFIMDGPYNPNWGF